MTSGIRRGRSRARLRPFLHPDAQQDLMGWLDWSGQYHGGDHYRLYRCRCARTPVRSARYWPLDDRYRRRPSSRFHRRHELAQHGRVCLLGHAVLFQHYRRNEGPEKVYQDGVCHSGLCDCYVLDYFHCHLPLRESAFNLLDFKK